MIQVIWRLHFKHVLIQFIHLDFMIYGVKIRMKLNWVWKRDWKQWSLMI